MPQLINPRHERFVRHWRKTGNASAAYIAAGYQPTNRNTLDACASRMLRSAKIRSRLRELERSMVQKTEISLASLLNDLAEDRRQAKALGQMAPAIQATQLAAKLTGFLVDRKESGGPGDFAGLKALPEIMDAIRGIVGDQAAAAIEAALAPSEAAPEASELVDLGEVPDEKSLN